MHLDNPHNGSYDMQALSKALPELEPFLITGQKGQLTLDFSDPLAIKALNKAILKKDYQIDFWDLPQGYLCPPIPGRVDYLYHLKDLLPDVKDRGVNVLDIGTGANLIYPLTGSRAFNWRFVASDIDTIAVNCAKELVKVNKGLAKQIKVRQQSDKNKFFSDIITGDEYFDLSLCNPPFHASQQDATASSERKNKNLKHNKDKRGSTLQARFKNDSLNFSGQNNELWCEGGELSFIKSMITESVNFKEQVGVFTCLVSKKENIAVIQKILNSLNVPKVKFVDMGQGNKISRFVAWSFYPELL